MALLNSVGVRLPLTGPNVADILVTDNDRELVSALLKKAGKLSPRPGLDADDVVESEGCLVKIYAPERRESTHC